MGAILNKIPTIPAQSIISVLSLIPPMANSLGFISGDSKATTACAQISAISVIISTFYISFPIPQDWKHLIQQLSLLAVYAFVIYTALAHVKELKY